MVLRAQGGNDLPHLRPGGVPAGTPPELLNLFFGSNPCTTEKPSSILKAIVKIQRRESAAPPAFAAEGRGLPNNFILGRLSLNLSVGFINKATRTRVSTSHSQVTSGDALMAQAELGRARNWTDGLPSNLVNSAFLSGNSSNPPL